MPDISAQNRSVQLSSAAADFFEVARLRAYGKANGAGSALRLAQSRGTLTPRTREMLESKTAVPVGNLGGFGAELALVDQAASMAFLSLLPPFSSFDRILADRAFTPMPMHSRLGVAQAAAIAATVGENSAKPITRMSFSTEIMPQQKAVGTVVFSKELLVANDARVNQVFEQGLRDAVAVETDRQFISIISSGTGVPSRPSSGMTAANFVHDLELAQEGIETGISSRLYLITPRPVYFGLKLLRDSGGWIVSPQDTVGAITIVPTSAKTVTNSILIDSTAVGADGGIAVPDGTGEALINMDDTGSGGQVFSLWQQNYLASRVERLFGAAVLRAEGVAVITGLDVTA